MLQQTTVAMASPRYESFVKAFPTLADLARATEQDVLRHWQGLGYYRRARHLHAAARLLFSIHGGQLPDNPEIWAGLPGIGRYILGAVLSQAFDRRLPIVEANSTRVLCRLFGRRDDPKSGGTRKWLWDTAQQMLPQTRVGDFNQAVMELGAIVCTPKKPRCAECPIAGHCKANFYSLQDDIPLKPRPKTFVKRTEVALVIWREKKVLFVQRPPHGRWSNMWEFPHIDCPLNSDVAGTARRFIKMTLGLKASIGNKLAEIRHVVTNERVVMICMEAKYNSGDFCSPFYVSGRWLSPKQLCSLPTSTPQRKLIQLVTSLR